ncbi:NADPH-dependent F420 reductase [Mumia sp. zg.B53]|uniref:NADPH-dependent F420 reductase n=1 Tax=unclassified Mumia TaxID=2621872 RepID=UPI001C6ECB70|nr:MULTISPECIES: NADPH-dependent F420 reductase [unclassified Mumia]MBW9206845.1 NADPH-dependent F420 reductase [Mumia sp. zg.B17]MBW9210868.1 NADPH-dependent F420 reductase [Mumia sp. zg.B21]MBW9215433.1 NADPH-dependent F420 reductase [Mumia sp. zg.B53]MDD9349999.1 NADPH-dependent F420 reductase [Mumia sp.]
MTHHIAVVGGTGPQGRGLAYRFALAGHTVVIGSRSAERAAEKAEEISTRAADNGATVRLDGATNADAAAAADVVVLAVPWDGYDALVADLAPALDAKIVISCVNPLGFDAAGPYGLTLAESAAEGTQKAVPGARVVGAFHHLAALSLWKTPDPLSHEDVLVCGDDAEAKDLVADLARTVTGHRGIDAGALRIARQLEPFTAVLINVNKRYKVRSGLHLAGLPDDARA